MALFSSVPVVDVHKDNFVSLWPSLILAIRTSSYVSIDAELSGLGNRKNLLSRNMEDRYQSLVGVAKTRSVLSLGLSCFKAKGVVPRSQSATAGSAGETGQELGFVVQTFNITSLCSEDYTVEPGSLKFLVDHGFDFNKQYALGVPYHRGLDKDEEKEGESQTLRALFSELIKSAKPIVFHNALVDLVFLYHNLYSELPASSSHFITDLYEMFPGGIFDTKYLAEFEARMPASYLEYVFRRSQRGNARLASGGRQHIGMEFCQYDKNLPFIGYYQCALPAGFNEQSERTFSDQVPTVKLCETYAGHGYCKNGVQCPLSHDPDAIQDADEEREERRRRKRKRKQRKQQQDKAEDSTADKTTEEDLIGENPHENMEVTEEGDKTEEGGTDGRSGTCSESKTIKSGDGMSDRQNHTGNQPADKPLEKLTKQTKGHRAGYDAFMTGFAMATLALSISGLGPSQLLEMKTGEGFTEAFRLSEVKNKLFLSAKPVPLLIAKSGFAKASQTHRDKMKRLGFNLS